tara:strand:- start:1675 stop:1932 length:258 start_codon:yes stop_codon:yes gene_type:complete
MDRILQANDVQSNERVRVVSEHSKRRQEADAAFKKVQKGGGKSAPGSRPAYETIADDARTNSARLKELRLARDEAAAKEKRSSKE